MAIDARRFLGRDCNQMTRGRECGDPAEYLVHDGEVPMLTCARHLLDTVEEVVGSSYLTVDSDPLGITRLSEEEMD